MGKKSAQSASGFSKTGGGNATHNPLQQALLQVKQLYSQKQMQPAVQLCQQIIQQYPKDSQAYYLLGSILYELKDVGNAHRFAHACTQLKPSYAAGWELYGEVCSQLGMLREAQKAMKKLARLDDKNADSHCRIATFYMDNAQYEAAEKHYLKAIRLDASHGLAHRNLARLYSAYGEWQKLEAFCRTHYEQGTEKPEMLWMLVNYFPRTISEAELQQAEEYAAQGEKLENLEGAFEFALSRYYGRVQKDQAKEMEVLHRGNKRRGKYALNIPQESYQIHLDSRKIFTAEWFAEKSLNRAEVPRIDEAPTPIFVMGMPRSGTTLTDRIIAAHDGVVSVGESQYLSKYRQDILRQMLGRPEIQKTVTHRLLAQFPYPFAHINKPELQLFAQAYLEHLIEVAATHPTDEKVRYVVNKLPGNYLFYGLIRAALPHAIVIYCDRDVRDIGLSTYQQLFGKEVAYAFDLEDIADHLNQHQQLMQHWKQVTPDGFFHASYEALVTDPETATKAMMEYAGIAWQEKALDLSSTEGAIFTASVDQARKEIYTGSKEKWRKYEDHIQPLLARLNHDIHAEPYAQGTLVEGFSGLA